MWLLWKWKKTTEQDLEKQYREILFEQIIFLLYVIYKYAVPSYLLQVSNESYQTRDTL